MLTVGIFGTKAPVCAILHLYAGNEHDSQHTFWENVLGPPGTCIIRYSYGTSPTFREARPTDQLDHLVGDRCVTY